MNGADALDFGRASVAMVIRIRFYSSPTPLCSAPGEIARRGCPKRGNRRARGRASRASQLDCAPRVIPSAKSLMSGSPRCPVGSNVHRALVCGCAGGRHYAMARFHAPGQQAVRCDLSPLRGRSQREHLARPAKGPCNRSTPGAKAASCARPTLTRLFSCLELLYNHQQKSSHVTRCKQRLLLVCNAKIKSGQKRCLVTMWSPRRSVDGLVRMAIENDCYIFQ